jgi:hypothetical protein
MDSKLWKIVHRLWSIVIRRIVLLEQAFEKPRQGGVDGVVATAMRGQQADVGGFI